MLFDDGEEDNVEVDVNVEWKVNENFVKWFMYNKQREDLYRLQEFKKKGWVGLDFDDFELEDEDEDGLLFQKMDIQIFEMLVKIKKKDLIIYKFDVKFYDDVDDEGEDGNVGIVEKKKKLFYLKDV